MERFVEEADLDFRYFQCCGNEGLYPFCCPQCGRMMVWCYECDTLYTDLSDLRARNSDFDSNSKGPIVKCPECGYRFSRSFLRDRQFKVPWDLWTATARRRLLVNCFLFPPYWVGGELPGFRECESTYCRYDYRSLPPVPTHLFDGSFAWLRREPSPLQYDTRFAEGFWDTQNISYWKDKTPEARTNLLAVSAKIGSPIPEAFLTFIFDVELVSRMRSPTDCFFHLPSAPISHSLSQGGHFLHFLSDSQNVSEWYLYIHPKNDHCVVASSGDLSPSNRDIVSPHGHERIVFCAESFEEFIFRLWIENEIWFRIVEQDQPLNREMCKYLKHYQEGHAANWVDEDP